MRPRVFVSSTYYDLRHVRERLEKFVSNYGFEAILFETDKVTYEHGKPIDTSAYFEVTLCHIMILIIGGRYGSVASLGDRQEEYKRYENEYVSITRKEFETANERNLPIFVFIDKNVYSEFQTYKENQELFEDFEKDSSPATARERKLRFAHVDDINIFRFIEVVRVKPVKTFDRVEEIENYLQNQFAGMFYLYLDNLQKQNEVNKVLNTVAELNNITLQMNTMLNSVGRKILGNENPEYEKVIAQQLNMLIDFFADQFFELIAIEDYYSISEDVIDEVTRIIFKEVVDIPSPVHEKLSNPARQKLIKEYDDLIKEKLNKMFEERDIRVEIGKIQAFRINLLYRQKVRQFLATPEDKERVIKRLKEEVEILILS